MENKNLKKLLLVLGIGLLIPASLTFIQKVKTLVTNGLETSKKIRISDSVSPSCENQNDTHFSGCNSIL